MWRMRGIVLIIKSLPEGKRGIAFSVSLNNNTGTSFLFVFKERRCFIKTCYYHFSKIFRLRTVIQYTELCYTSFTDRLKGNSFLRLRLCSRQKPIRCWFFSRLFFSLILHIFFTRKRSCLRFFCCSSLLKHSLLITIFLKCCILLILMFSTIYVKILILQMQMQLTYILLNTDHCFVLFMHKKVFYKKELFYYYYGIICIQVTL